MIDAFYRNLGRGKGWNAHNWSRAESAATRAGSYGRKLEDMPAGDDFIVLNATASYINPNSKKMEALRAGGKRTVFAWYRGKLSRSAAGFKRGERVGMRPDKGEFTFRLVDRPGRPPAPAVIPALLFTSEGLFIAERA